MALLFMDGFDAADILLKYSSASYFSTSTTTRFGTGRSGLGRNASNQEPVLRKDFAASQTIWIGLAYSSTHTFTFLQTYGDGGATNHINVRYIDAVTVGLFRGSTEIGRNNTSGHSSWHYYELGVYVSDTVGWAKLYVDGVELIDFSGDTKNGGTNNSISTFRLTGDRYGANSYFDDLYVDDSDRHGDVRVHTLTPDAAGTTTQLTPSSGANYTTVDELPYSTADYVYGTPGQKDTYSTSNLPGGTGIIYGVQTNAIVKKTDAGTISGRPVVRAGATDYPGTAVSVGTSDTVISKLDQVNPATSTAWTSGDVNGMEIGVETV